jgi:alkylated DNA repair dioxygenase AlkB
MDLFESLIDKNKNLLPYNGEVFYYGKIFTEQSSNNYLTYLLNDIEWKHDEVVIYGKHITTKRKVAWYADDHFKYNYSNITRKAQLWTNMLLELKNIVEQTTSETFNSCLLNLYHDGDEGMSWHSDDEKELVKNGTIASLSFGAERKFVFKHRQSKIKVEVFLNHGSLLLMQGTTQTYWLHSLAKTKKVTEPRVNLTFRKFLV